MQRLLRPLAAGVAAAGLLTAMLLAGGGLAVPAPAAAATDPATISATGTGAVAMSNAGPGNAVNVMVQEHAKVDDLQTAVRAVQDRLAAIRAALQAAGVPAAGIHDTGFNINGGGMIRPVPLPAMGGGGAGEAEPATEPSNPPAQPMPMPMPMPMPIGLPMPGYVVNANLQVDVIGTDQLVAAMQAATKAGASSVNAFMKGRDPNAQPDTATLGPAIADATAQAKALAQASAQAGGLTLGSLKGLTVAPPVFTGFGPGLIGWRVQVTAVYNAG